MSHTSTAFAFQKMKCFEKKFLVCHTGAFSFKCSALLCMCQFARAETGAVPDVFVIFFTLGVSEDF